LTTQDTVDSATVASPARAALARRDWGLLASFAGIAAATLYLSFNAGGFFVSAPALVALGLLLCLLLRFTLAARPLEGIGTEAGVAIAGMALYSVWTLASELWSHSPSRALIEFDRAMLYTVALTLLASFTKRGGRQRALLAGLTSAIVVVATIAIITRLLPRVWPLAPDVSEDRLSYPLTYWNALGLLLALGIIGALHFATSARERLGVRVLATAALPLLVTTLYFTLSRGAMAVGAVGVLLFLLLARARGTVPVAIAALPTSAVAVLVGYHAAALTSDHPTSAQAVHQGHHVVIALVAAIVVAAVLRAVLAPLERRLKMPRWPLPFAPWIAVTGVVVVAIAALFASGVAQREIHNFGQTDAIANLSNQRARLTSVSNNGRFSHWHVAIDAFDAHPLVGTGAGTYQNLWAQHRNSNLTVINAHSLYLQVMAELGIIGLILILVPIVTILVSLIRGVRLSRGADRAIPAAVLAMGLMWAVHAGVDWDWEMPAVTLWFFMLGGASLATERQAAPVPAWSHAGVRRLLLGLGCLLLGVTPALLALSQLYLGRAAAALSDGNCQSTVSNGLSSISVLSVRPEPYELIGLCDVRLGANALAVRMERSAVDRDPNDWEFHYALAIVEAAAEIDPRAAARRAHQLNPREPLTQYALTLFDHGNPKIWRKRGLAAPLPP
jgi:O-Antigen ligase